MQGSFNIHLIAICSISFVVVAAFLLFDLDDKFAPVSASQYSANIDYTETPNQTIVSEPEPKMAKTIPVAQLAKPIIKIHAQKSPLNDLEGKQFVLDLSGDARPGYSNMAKKASLTLKMIPIKGTNLKEFSIIESRLLIDGSSAPVSGIGAKLDDKTLIIDFAADKADKFTVIVSLDEKIINDKNNKQNASLQDQNFYLMNKDTPYKVDLTGTLQH
ncbi:MAG: hypothetical protein ACKOCQ_06390 [Candidatus Nitrosotenuis sp.]